MVDTKQTICDSCRRLVPVSEIRYMQNKTDKNEIMALCSECRGSRSEPKKDTSQRTIKETSPRKLYFCDKCKYRFRSAVTQNTTIKCPYCGNTNKITEYDSVQK